MISYKESCNTYLHFLHHPFEVTLNTKTVERFSLFNAISSIIMFTCLLIKFFAKFIHEIENFCNFVYLQLNTTLQSGKYRIERVLGQGGFNNTYVGYNTEFEGAVAINEFFMKGVTGKL